LYVPRVEKNLISVAQLAGDKLWAFEFHPVDCIVKDFKTGKEIRRGKKCGRLYSLAMSAPDSRSISRLNSAPF
jgi:hypothetical protein